MKTVLGTSICAMLLHLNCLLNPVIHGSGEIVSEGRIVSGFHSISLEGMGKIYLTQDTVQSLVIETDDNLIELLETIVTDSNCTIDFEDDIRVDPTRLNIYISMAAVKSLAIYGSGDIICRDTLYANGLSLKISGSGDMTLPLVATTLSSHISGSGDYKLSGSTDDHTIYIEGSGDVIGYNLLSRKTEVTIAGSGDCKLTVTDSLDVTISGSGDVFYKGNPHVNSSIAGSGKVIEVRNALSSETGQSFSRASVVPFLKDYYE